MIPKSKQNTKGLKNIPLKTGLDIKQKQNRTLFKNLQLSK